MSEAGTDEGSTSGGIPSGTDILVVEDEPDVAGLYRGTLEAKQCNVDVAHSVGEALETVDGSYDVVLLDRRLPDGKGTEFLETVRDRGLDVRVGMVTAVVPDFDIVEMGFDLYLLKPVSKQELVDTVATLSRRSQYDETLQRTASLASKRAVLEAEKPTAELQASEEYDRLTRQLDELDEELTQITREFGTEDYRRMFRDIGSQSQP
ncbi:MAG: HalX domain-containing protein [Halolamina sp.]